MESEADSPVTKRTTRSKIKESPAIDKSKDRKEENSVKLKNKDSSDQTVDKNTKIKSESDDKDTSSDIADNVSDKNKGKGKKDIYECPDSAGKSKGKTNKSKFGKAGKAGKGKFKIKGNHSEAELADWADKRPTPSMDYNESNAKCPLPGCDSKGIHPTVVDTHCNKLHISC